MAAAAIRLACDPSDQPRAYCGGSHSTRTRGLDSQSLRHLSNGRPLLPGLSELLQSIGYRDRSEIEVTIKPLLHQSSYSAPALAAADPYHAAIHHEKSLLSNCHSHQFINLEYLICHGQLYA